MQVCAATIEQSNVRGVDVLDLIGSLYPESDQWLCWMDTEPCSSPPELPDETMPGGRRGEDLAKPLSEDRESACGDVTVLG